LSAFCPPWLSLAVGVGKSFKELAGFGTGSEDEDSFSAVCGSDVGSSKACPLRVIPERGQVAEYTAESPATERGDVLQDDELRSKYAKAFGDGEPEPTTRSLRNAQCRPRDRRN
jgi:hypothetical protein